MFVLKTAAVSVILITIFYAIIWFVKHLLKYKDIDKLPGPSAIEFLSKLLGNNSPAEKYQYVIGLSRKYGSILKIRVTPFDASIMVTDTEYIEKILLSKEHLGKSTMYDVLHPYIERGSIAVTSDASIWKKERKISSTAFQHSTLIGYLSLINKYTDKFIESIRSRSIDSAPLDIQSLAHDFTLDLVFETITGRFNNFQENRSYITARDEFLGIVADRLYSPLLMKEFLFKLTGQYKRMVKLVQILNRVTSDTITRIIYDKNDSSDKDTKHLVGVLLADNIEHHRLRSFINTFIAAGSDTTAQALSICLYQLSKYPVHQQKLYEEITSKLGTDVNAVITNADLLEMKYLEAVIKESMRIVPVVPLFERKLSFDVNINGINYPKDTLFVFNLEVLHRSEKYFKDPDKFDPDRFMPENVHLFHRNSFIPFSVGPRDCVGKLYAMQLLKYVVAKIVQNFQMKSVKNHELKLVHKILTKSENGIPIIFTERK